MLWNKHHSIISHLIQNRGCRGLILQEQLMTSVGIRFAVIVPGGQTHLFLSTWILDRLAPWKAASIQGYHRGWMQSLPIRQLV